MMFFDGLYLFVPQEEVRSVEIIVDVQFGRQANGTIGKFSPHGEEAPVYCLSKELTLITDLPKTREFFTLLHTEDNLIGIACDEVETINFAATELYVQDIPPVMRQPGSPFTQFVIYQDSVACISTGMRFIHYILKQSEQYQLANEL